MVVTRCMLPIHVVQLDHGEVPFHIHIHHIIECSHIAVERPTEITDTSCFTFLQEEVKQTIVDESFLEGFDTLTTTDRVEEIVVDIIHLKILQRIAIHFYRLLEIRNTRVRHLGCNEELVAWMTLEGNTHSSL